jgi:hypothetical protein
VRAREVGREQVGYGRWSVEDFYDGFVRTTPRVGIWLDTSEETPRETVAEILASTSSERAPLALADYDSGWPVFFERLAEPHSPGARRPRRRARARRQHRRSRLAAKPIIDVDVVVASAARAGGDRVPAPARLRLPGRQGFAGRAERPSCGRRAAAPSLRRRRDAVGRTPTPFASATTCAVAPRFAEEYAELKKALAHEHGDDRPGYAEARSEFIAGVLAEAVAES